MEAIIHIVKLYAVIFSLLLTCYYHVPVAIWYYVFFVTKREKWKHQRIQKKFPDTKHISREIKYSVLSIAIFSIISLVLYLLILDGYTKMYFRISDYGVAYFIASPFIAFFIHDTMFYWTHRFMHLKKVFKYFHLVHHKSTNPTPWSIYAFQPGEAIIQSSIYPILVFLLPIHPLAMVFFMLYNMFINLAGHGGFEFMPEQYRTHWLFRWQNSVSNHDRHHTNVTCNYGFYFTFWDRVMKTIQETNVHTETDKKS